MLDILPEIGQMEFLEGDVGCPSSVDKDVCAEPLMKSCFRKSFEYQSGTPQTGTSKDDLNLNASIQFSSTSSF